MSLKARFIVSLILILLLSWADVFFVGTHSKMFIPTAWHQPIHFIALLTTMIIGYLNWKDYPEKWLASLWLAAYGIMIIVLMLTAALYFVHVPHSMVLVRSAIYLRNRFTWPLPFLVWYMLHLSGKYMATVKNERG